MTKMCSVREPVKCRYYPWFDEFEQYLLLYGVHVLPTVDMYNAYYNMIYIFFAFIYFKAEIRRIYSSKHLNVKSPASSDLG